MNITLDEIRSNAPQGATHYDNMDSDVAYWIFKDGKPHMFMIKGNELYGWAKTRADWSDVMHEFKPL